MQSVQDGYHQRLSEAASHLSITKYTTSRCTQIVLKVVSAKAHKWLDNIHQKNVCEIVGLKPPHALHYELQTRLFGQMREHSKEHGKFWINESKNG